VYIDSSRGFSLELQACICCALIKLAPFFLLPVTCSLSPCSPDVGYRFVIYSLYNVEECAFYSLFLESYYERMLIFFKGFFYIYWDDDVILGSLNYVYWFAYVVPSLHPCKETFLIMVYDLFSMLLDSIIKYFIENFWICVPQRYWSITSFLVHLYWALVLG
jgi:hypothetical protein